MTEPFPMPFRHDRTQYEIRALLPAPAHPSTIVLVRSAPPHETVVPVIYWAHAFITHYEAKLETDRPDPPVAWVAHRLIPLVVDPATCELRPLYQAYDLPVTPPTWNDGAVG